MRHQISLHNNNNNRSITINNKVLWDNRPTPKALGVIFVCPAKREINAEAVVLCYIDAMAVLRDATEPTCIVYMEMIYTHSVCAQPNTKAFESDKSVHWTRQFEYNVIYYYLELLWDSMLNSCIELAVALSLSPSLSLPWTHFALCIFVASASMQMLLYWCSLLFFSLLNPVVFVSFIFRVCLQFVWCVSTERVCLCRCCYCCCFLCILYSVVYPQI